MEQQEFGARSGWDFDPRSYAGRPKTSFRERHG